MARDIDFDGLANLLRERTRGARAVVAFAGAPGSGKSTLAERLVDRLNENSPGIAAILPMDGYHFDDRLLDQLGRRPRKGAPDTFDVGGLRQMLERLRRNDEDAVAIPVFDRDIEIARAGARLIPAATRIIVAEGNYLLLRDPPWSGLRPLFDVAVSVDVAEEILRQRLEARWNGYGLDAAEVRAKVEDNDLPNARLVVTRSMEPDFLIRN